MLQAFSFRAKPGKEKEFEQLLNNPEAGRAAARAQGATRNILFLSKGRMIRILEFPDGAKPVPISELAKKDPNVMAFVLKTIPLIEDAPDPDRPETFEEFNKQIMFTLAYDVKV